MTLVDFLLLLACLMAFRPVPKKGKPQRKPRRPIPRKGPFRVKGNPFKTYRSPRPDYEATARRRAAEQRSDPPEAEVAFNQILISLGFAENVDYKWQDVLFYPGKYAIIDFAFWKRRTLIEIDGPSHDEAGQGDHDIGRDAYCRAQGFKVVRIKNRVVLTKPDLCRDIVLAELGITK